MGNRREDRRLAVLRQTELLDSLPELAFDRIVRLAARLLGMPVALISLVDDRRQFFKSAVGLEEPWASRRETPLTHSFCQHVCRTRSRLVVADAREHPELRHNLAVADLAVVAYAGVPLFVLDEPIGALCVIDNEPRAWSDDDVGLLEDLSASIVAEIELRMALRQAREQRAFTESIVESVGDAILAVDTERNFVIANGAARSLFAEEVALGKSIPENWSRTHRSTDVEGRPFAAENGPLLQALRGIDTNGLAFASTRPGASGPVWVEGSGRSLRDSHGKIVGAVAAYRDVTERRKQADLYSAFVQNIPHGVVTIFDKGLRCVAIDGAVVRADDRVRERLIGQTMRELAGAVDDERFDRIETMYRRVLEGESLKTDFDLGERCFALQMGPVRDGTGAVTAGIVLALEVTFERRLASTLRRQEQIDRAILRNLPKGAVFMVDRDMRFVAADGPILPEALRRANLDDVVGRRVDEVLQGEGREAILQVYRDALDGISRHAEFQRGDLFFEVSTAPVFENARVSHALVFVFDVTERRREAESLRQTRDSLTRERKLFEATLEHLVEGVVLIDPARKVLLANSAYAEMVAMDPKDVVGMTFEQFAAHVSPLLADPRSLVDRLGAAPPTGAVEFTLARPRRRILRRVWTSVALDVGMCTLAMWHDVTSERDLLAEREQQLLVDALTGVPNRRAAEAALKAEHDRIKRYGTRLCVAVIDIDHFKRVNDDWGHAVGDDVLRRVAGTLAAQARASDTVARWGGEEFVAILPVGIDGARASCERIRKVVEATRCGPAGAVTISIGVAEMAAEDAVADVIVRADARLYDAKRGGRNRVCA